MAEKFNTIGVIGKPDHDGAKNTVMSLITLLQELGHDVIVEDRIVPTIEMPNVKCGDLVDIGKQCQLAIVVGGDGFMLGAARVLSRFNIAVVGVNRGNLGFLTDLSPDNFEEPLLQLLKGDYVTEMRFLLEVEVYRHAKLKSSNSAVNEAVLHANKVAHMIHFEVFIDDVFAYALRSDGLIVATPTGSTAYSLSAGGPILPPDIDALSLVPMFPHTFSSRPLVVDANRQVRINVCHGNQDHLQVSCDGHVLLAVLPGDEIIIKKSPYELRLVHPKDYSYFNVLRSKLGWSSSNF